MGQEISRIDFTERDYAEFQARLRTETALLDQWLKYGRFSPGPYVAGFELEAWLVDHNYLPVPTNEHFLSRLNDPLVVPELSKFNVELNGTPQRLLGRAFSHLADELQATWQRCQQVCHEQGHALLTIGILPTIRDQDLCLENISTLNRYYALNEQVLRQRRGRPFVVNIEGRERLSITHHDVMLEAATTSFQIHLKVPPHEAARVYNASQILAGPMLAASPNAPFLFEKDLWDETRIPLFEQAVDVCSEGQDPSLRRVSFGTSYLRDSGLEIFTENLARYPVLLPICFEEAPESFSHVRLHNGTIWRWNRLLIGFDGDGTPHLRIEHRVLPAGPSILDMIANLVFYVGLVHFLANLTRPPEDDLPFDQARQNFYTAARYGLDAGLHWLGGTKVNARSLLLDELIPMAKHGLKDLDLDDDESEEYLDILSARIELGLNGTVWQRSFVDRHGADFVAMTARYCELQRSRAPVHQWEIA